MNILVAVSSRHGSTREMGDAIARELRVSGHNVDIRDADEVDNIEKYDAAILGSAIYMGNWLAGARHLVERNSTGLAKIPVWLFSSGPLGRDTPQPIGDPAHVAELMKATGAKDHRVFVGDLDKSKLGVAERFIVKMVSAPEGDFREWKDIRAWAREIASTLQVPSASAI